MLFSDALGRFLASRRAYCSQATVAWYRYMLGPLSDRWSDLGGLSVGDLEKWIVEERERGLSASSVGGKVRAVKAFGRWCVDRGYVRRSAAVGLKGPRVERLPKYLTRVEVSRLLAAVDSGSGSYRLRDGALVRFMLDSGCRVSEVVGLRVEDLDLSEGFADVVGKGGKVRRVGVAESADWVRRYVGSRKSGRVFLSGSGKALTRWGVREVLRRVGRRTGMRLYPHLLRHTFGTRAVELGMDVSHLQVLMGHARVETTLIYCESARVVAALAAHKKFSPLLS